MRIAGLASDDRAARTVHQTARIYTYARRIRRLAHDAADLPDVTAMVPTEPSDVWHSPRGILRRP